MGLLYFQLVVHVFRVGDPVGNFSDDPFFIGGVDRPAQGDMSILGDYLDVACVRGHVVGGDDSLGNGQYYKLIVYTIYSFNYKYIFYLLYSLNQNYTVSESLSSVRMR